MNSLKNIDRGKFQLVIIVLITLTAGVYRNGFPAIFPFMQAEFDISRAQMGLYISFLYMVSAALAVFSGWVADRVGAKTGLFWGTASLGVLIALHALAPTYALILFLGIVCGVGFSIVSPGASKAVADQYPAEERGTPMGLIFVGWSVGGLLGAVVLPTFSQMFGWRSAALGIGILMLGVIIAFRFIYDEPKKQPEDRGEGARVKDSTSLKEGFMALVTDPTTLLLGFVGLSFGSLSGILATHYPLFVHMDYGYSETLAGIGFAFLHAGSIVGRPTWGRISDSLLAGRDYLGFLLISVINCAVMVGFGLLSRFFSVPPVWVVLALAFLAGFSGRGWQGMLFTTVSRKASRKQAGMALGFALVFVRLGITVAPPLFGYVADLTDSYELGWFLAAIITVAAGFLFYVIGTRQKRNNSAESSDVAA